MKLPLMHMFFFLAISLASLTGCPVAPDDDARSITVDARYHFPYDLRTPDETFKLPYILEEISGLAMTEDGQYLVAVQDEDGLVFFIERQTGEVARQFEFWKKGDYEGVEVIGDTIYVVRSNGTLYEIVRGGEPDQAMERYKLALTGKNDVEGLTYDRANRRLLLACKGEPGLEEVAYPGMKAVYGFCLETKTLQEEPVFLISMDSILQYLEMDPEIRKLDKLLEFFDEENEKEFSPSAIEIHPITDNIFITSSVGKMLIVLDAEGRLLHIEKLSKKVHPQPEGLSFDREGNMYISNEGRGKKGTIHRFAYRADDNRHGGER
jgi:uncharacterized protein YjiK